MPSRMNLAWGLHAPMYLPYHPLLGVCKLNFFRRSVHSPIHSLIRFLQPRRRCSSKFVFDALVAASRMRIACQVFPAHCCITSLATFRRSMLLDVVCIHVRWSCGRRRMLSCRELDLGANGVTSASGVCRNIVGPGTWLRLIGHPRYLVQHGSRPALVRGGIL